MKISYSPEEGFGVHKFGDSLGAFSPQEVDAQALGDELCTQALWRPCQSATRPQEFTEQ